MKPVTDERDGRASFSRYPMLIVAVCFAAGIVIAKYAGVNARAAAAMCAASAAAALVFRSRSIATAFVAVAFAAAGMLASYTEQASVRSDRIKALYDSGAIASNSVVELEGALASRPEPSFEGEFLTLRAESLRYRGDERAVSGNARIFVPQPASESGAPAATGLELSILNSQFPTLKYGSRVRVACRLRREDEYLDPGVVRRTEMLDRMGVDAGCTVKTPLLIEHMSDESVFVPLAWVYDQRAALIDQFRAHLDHRTAAVMIASLLGDKFFLDKDTADLFRDGGTFHILVISGLHITFIGGLLLLLVRRSTRNSTLR